MSTIADFYANSVKDSIGKENWAKISAGKADPDILAIAKLCAIATGKESINDIREEQALIAKATKGLQKLGIGKNLTPTNTLLTEDSPNLGSTGATGAPGDLPVENNAAGVSGATGPDESTGATGATGEANPQLGATGPTGPSNPTTGISANSQDESNLTNEEVLAKLKGRKNTLELELANGANEERREAIQKELRIIDERINARERDQREESRDEARENKDELKDEMSAATREQELAEAKAKAEREAAQAQAALEEANRKLESQRLTNPVRTETEQVKADNALRKEELNTENLEFQKEQMGRRRQRAKVDEIRRYTRDLDKIFR